MRRVLLKGREIINLPVVNLEMGEEIGIVQDLLCDLQNHQVIYLLLESKGKNKKLVVPLDQIIGIGEDAVTVQSQSSCREEQLPESYINIKEQQGFLVITPEGKNLGTVEDLVVNFPGGGIVGYEISAGLVEDLIAGRSVLAAQNVLNWGKDAIVVKDISEIKEGKDDAVPGLQE